jgi:periplasmic divalent cation tolerance protein
MLIVFTTVSGESEGVLLAEKLVEAKLAACVQIVPRITSVYFWEGKVQKENEQLLLIKTSEDKYRELEKFISENHSYDVPEIVAISSENVAEPFRRWLEEYLAVPLNDKR